MLIAIQAGCLVVGLWMLCHFAKASAVRNAQDDAWSELIQVAENAAARVPTVQNGSSGERAEAHRAGHTWVGASGSPTTSALLFDTNGQLVWSTSAGADAENALTTWTPDEDTPETLGSSSRRGRITVAHKPQLAAVVVLANGDRLIVHRPADVVARSAEAATRSMPAISVLAAVWTVVLLAVVAYTLLSRVHDQIDHERLRSATETLRQTQNLVRTRDAVIFGLAKLADSRDPETGDHLERISVYSTTLASAMRRHPKYRDEVTPAFVRLIGISSALHDIGKVGVADSILRKSGPLTADEREQMQIHTSIGGECLRELEQRLGGSNFLQMAREIAYAHHENWDGSGHPNGLAGDEIPLAARIVAIADVYDALSSRRVYKDPMAHRKCVSIIKRKAGQKFDPDLVELWLTVESKFENVARQFAYRAGETLPDGEPDIAAPEYRDEREDLYAVAAVGEPI